MISIPIVQVDAFTDRPFGGNPAAVVLDAGGLDVAQMQAIAKEMNLSETAFLSPSESGHTDFRLRWFTPGGEVTFCGHATIATGHALHEAGRFIGPRISFDTSGGVLGLAREGQVFWLEPEPRRIRTYTDPVAPILAAMNLEPDDLADWAKPALSTERDLMLPCKRLDVLGRAVSGAELARVGDSESIRGFALVTFETVEPTSKTHTRFYAPHLGIVEDPVTGSLHASLAVWLRGLGLAPEHFTAEQGDLMGRPGRLEIETKGPRVGGRAVTVLKGELFI